MNRTRSTLIGTAIAVALYGNQAVAQAPVVAELEEVVVTGIRASLTQSLDAKRAAEGVLDAISAEDVGKFPDKNLAEALQRVPGVQVNREFGEGERVTVRGTSPTLTRMLFNGHSLATADWFILDQLNTTRSFNYLMFPADIIGQAAVYKTSQADLEEGGIGGTIDVKTRNPLDLDELEISGSLQAVYTELADQTDPQATGLVSWKNSDETLGLLAAAVYQKREIRRDGVEVLGYFDADPGPAVARRPVAHRLGALRAGAYPDRRQRRRAVAALRRPRVQPDGAVLEVRRRQRQRELHSLGHTCDRQRRDADQHHDTGQHGGRRHDLVAERWHRGLRRRLRRDPTIRGDEHRATSTC